jgi:lysine 2,3-aminomutase
MELVRLKRVPKDAANDDGVTALKAPVDPASLVHQTLRSGPFWQRVPAYASVDEEKFLDHSWQGKNSITRVEKLLESLRGVVSDEFIRDAAVGFQRAPMSVRVTPYIMALIDWENPYTDPLRAVHPAGLRLCPITRSSVSIRFTSRRTRVCRA